LPSVYHRKRVGQNLVEKILVPFAPRKLPPARLVLDFLSS
jgi:hypothetical protein